MYITLQRITQTFLIVANIVKKCTYDFYADPKIGNGGN